ncbi:MAG: lamin tail domain-containing protein, partial [Chloroflexota bacterium]
GDNQSLTRNPDITGATPLIKHSTTPGAGGRLFSPGTKVDGSAFASCDIAPLVSSTNPITGATNVSINTDITVEFNEIVTTTPTTFALDCPMGTSIGLNIAPISPGNDKTFTLTPQTQLPYNTPCSLSVRKDQVTDQDGIIHSMTNDYSLHFTTVSTPSTLLISEFLYDGLTPSTEGDEFVEICNPNSNAVDTTGYKIGDEEVKGGGESMYQLPTGTILASNSCLVIADSITDFQARFGYPPDFEFGQLTKYTAWATGGWSLANTGDEVLLLGPNDEIIDSVAYRNGEYALLGLGGQASAPSPNSLQRVWGTDTNAMPHDFVKTEPTPKTPTIPPPAPPVPPAANLPEGMKAFWGNLHAHSTYSDGSGPPHYAFDLARAAGLHFYGLTDHGWWLVQNEWDQTQIQAVDATVPNEFIALRGIEWTHDSLGHINIFNTNTLTQRTNPLFSDLSGFYTWLAANPTVIAQFNHPDPSYGGTFANFAHHPAAAPMITMQEIGNNAQHYTTYEASFLQSNFAGWRTAPTNNSDSHGAKWGTDTNARTGIIAPALTETDLLDAMRARRIFATEDSNLAVALRVDGAWMGSVLPQTGHLNVTVDVVDFDSEPFTLALYDTNLLLETVPVAPLTGQSTLSTTSMQWSTTINAKPGHFFWVKITQADGDIAYSAPVWIDGKLSPERIVLNEILPAPYQVDWNSDGTANADDEWLELFNPTDQTVGLGGWRLSDTSNVSYNIPLDVTIPARGYALFHKSQLGFSMNNSGDTITLTHPNGTVVDTFSYTSSPGSDEPWCRLPDGNDTWSDRCGPSPNEANWEIPSAGPLSVTIYEAKQLTRGAWVTVRGQVTVPPGPLGARTMYIQDETAGISIYLPKDHGLSFKLGDKVEIEGNLRTFHEEFEISVRHRSKASFLEAGPSPPPLPIATTSLLEPYEGRLVMLQGQAVSFRGRTRLWVDDGTGWAQVYIRTSTGIKRPYMPVGTPLTVIGIVGQRSDPDNPTRHDYRLQLRFQSDLIMPESPKPATNWPTILPETGYE